jgi:hypothetical protein
MKKIIAVSAAIILIAVIATVYLFVQPESVDESDFTLTFTVTYNGDGSAVCAAALKNDTTHVLRVNCGMNIVSVYIVKSDERFESVTASVLKKIFFGFDTKKYSLAVAETGSYKAVASAAFEYKDQRIFLESEIIYFNIA